MKSILLQTQEIAEFETIDNKKPSTAYVVIYKIIT